jgi:branched-chain amino acid transport system ATP-binding protein
LASSLTIANIDAGYGAVRVLDDVSLTVGAGETVALLGTNGNGKSTLMKSVMGMVRPSAGKHHRHDRRHVPRAGRPLDRGDRRSRHRLRAGGTAAFPQAHRHENLLLGAFRPTARSAIRATSEFCFETFPR